MASASMKNVAGLLFMSFAGLMLACDRRESDRPDLPTTSSSMPATVATTQISSDYFKDAFRDSPDLLAVREVLANQLAIEIDEIQPNSTLADLQMDELDLVETVMTLEDKFGITITDEAIDDAANNAKHDEFFKNLTVHKLAFLVTDAKKTK